MANANFPAVGFPDNFPVAVRDDIVPTPYGLEHLRVYDCPTGGTGPGRLYAVVAVPAGDDLHHQPAQPGRPRLPAAPLLAFSTTSPDHAIDAAVDNLHRAAARP